MAGKAPTTPRTQAADRTRATDRTQDDFDRAVQRRLGPLSDDLDLPAFQAVWLLHQAADAARRVLETTALARHGLTWTKFEVLWHLWIFGEDEPRHICHAIGIPKSSLTTTVVQLEEAGHVRRRGSAEDGRRVIVTITPKGSRFMAAVFPGFNRAETRLTSGLSGQQADQLSSLLRLLIEQEHAVAREPVALRDQRRPATPDDGGSDVRPRAASA